MCIVLTRNLLRIGNKRVSCIHNRAGPSPIYKWNMNVHLRVEVSRGKNRNRPHK